MFYDEGRLKTIGDRLQNFKLARSFRALASDGNSMHSGQLAKALVQDIRDEGGIITEEDLEIYKIDEQDAITFEFETFKFHVPPVSKLFTSFCFEHRPLLFCCDAENDLSIKKDIRTQYLVLYAV